MEIIITIKEVRPGILVTKVAGHGRATPLEQKMTRHVVTSLDGVFKSFDQIGGTTSFGKMELKETDVPPTEGNGHG